MKPFLTIKELKEKLDKKEISKKEIIKFYLDRLKKYDNKIQATLDIFEPEEKYLDSLENNNKLLSGIPCVIKDNICQKNKIASCASKILYNYKAPYNATVVEKLNQAGSISLARANMDEFAMGSTGEYSAYKITKNPWNIEHVPGGSSSGSTATVAAGLVPFALGSETGGSVRTPASFCNLVGLYPTYGLHSRFGLIAFASSTDQVGILTKTVYDNALIASVLSGHDSKDSTSININPVDYTQKLTGKLPENLTIGVIKESLESEGVDNEIKEIFSNNIKILEKMGAKIKYVTLETLKYGISVYFVVSRAEAASNLSRYDGSLYGLRDKNAKELYDMYLNSRHEGFGTEVKRRILVGNFVLASKNRKAFYGQADKVRSFMRAELNQVFKDVDLLLSPTNPTLPYKIGQKVNDPLQMFMADYFTVTNCVTGNPALSIQGGFSKSNLPVGFQFIGPRLSEQLIFQVAHAYQQVTDYHTKNPGGYE